MPVTIVTNIPEIKVKLDGHFKKNLYTLSEQILTDCNYYVRVDTGMMESTSLVASDLAGGTLIWDTPYAKKVYYTGNPSNNVNPNASLMWCEKAHDAFGKTWQALAQRLWGE